MTQVTPTKEERKAVAETKRLAEKVAATLPVVGLPIHKPRYRKRTNLDQISQIEQVYDQLDGAWHDWLEVARKYEHKVPSQDRYDIRHAILIELARARSRDCKPIPTLRAYRIASLMVALYWREFSKASVKVCVYDGIAKEPHCASCNHKPKANRCVWLALRPIESLDSEAADSEGNSVRLMDTIADDKAIDLDLWLDEKTFLLGCPMRLIEIATKKANSQSLSWKDHKYWERVVKKERAKYQKTLF